MMYDDIANNRENPVKGNIINRPDGPNVYTGVPHDYTKYDVNPKTFLNVLAGKQELMGAGKKVINSGPNDCVFVNFVDHGAPGILGFGDSVLKAKDLMDTVKEMYQDKKYAKMVFYVEACESGSMFENILPQNINVFATTASNSHESSYACYFDKTRRTYLGDVYSVKWMEDSDREDLNTETLQSQFQIVKNETKTSHVMEFGDMTIAQMDVGEFLGSKKAKSEPNPQPAHPCEDAVKSEDVPLEILKRSLPLTQSQDEAADIAAKIIDLIGERKRVHESVKEIVRLSVMGSHQNVDNIMDGQRHSISDWDCYSTIVDYLQVKCKKTLNIPQNDYALRKLYNFVNMCESSISTQTMKLAIDNVCH